MVSVGLLSSPAQVGVCLQKRTCLGPEPYDPYEPYEPYELGPFVVEPYELPPAGTGAPGGCELSSRCPRASDGCPG